MLKTVKRNARTDTISVSIQFDEHLPQERYLWRLRVARVEHQRDGTPEVFMTKKRIARNRMTHLQ